MNEIDIWKSLGLDDKKPTDKTKMVMVILPDGTVTYQTIIIKD